MWTLIYSYYICIMLCTLTIFLVLHLFLRVVCFWSEAAWDTNQLLCITYSRWWANTPILKRQTGIRRISHSDAVYLQKRGPTQNNPYEFECTLFSKFSELASHGSITKICCHNHEFNIVTALYFPCAVHYKQANTSTFKATETSVSYSHHFCHFLPIMWVNGSPAKLLQFYRDAFM